MTNNNTTKGFMTRKTNVTPNVTSAGGTFGATLQDHFHYFGTFVCNGASAVTVTEPNITANCVVIITLKTVGGTVSPSTPYITTITPGSGFTVTGTASDTSTYAYSVQGFPA